jgi:protein-disulfide isomerase
MALAPKFAGQKLTSSAIQPKAVHTLELCKYFIRYFHICIALSWYTTDDHHSDLDYVCPFSAKMFKTIYETPLRKTLLEKYSDRVVTVFRQQIQPWHPSSTLVHEAAYAVQKVDSSKFWDFSQKLFAQQKDFFDVSLVNETRNATYKRLAKIAGSVGVDEGKVYGLLEISDKPGEDGALNSGNGVTDDVKVQVKANRLIGVHVTPTVVFDGVVNNEISSSWTAEQWEEWLEKNVK